MTKISNWDDCDYNEEDNIPLSELSCQNGEETETETNENETETDAYRDEIETTLQLLSKLTANTVLTIDEIENWNADTLDETDVDSNDEDDHEDNNAENSVSVSFTDAINAANVLIKWTEQNADLASKYMYNLLNMRSDIVKKQLLKPPKQTKLTSFFAKPNEK